uniref:LysR family transcriptional regulator n=1 Tax=Pseudomonas aeruginosa TaxID=287 RepID=UPI000B00BF77
MLLRHLRYLLAVAEHRNFTRAAEALHVSQPTLSQQVRQLEEQLRVQLLDRSGRSVRPTDAGELYLLHARRALRELEAAQRAIHEVRDLSRGRLRLGMTPTFTCYLARISHSPAHWAVLTDAGRRRWRRLPTALISGKRLRARLNKALAAGWTG